MGIGRHASINLATTQNQINEKIDLMGDFGSTIHYIPREADRRFELNDVYVKPKKKSQIKFTKDEIKYPSLIEAVMGNFKILPVFKKEGNIWVEMTE